MVIPVRYELLLHILLKTLSSLKKNLVCRTWGEIAGPEWYSLLALLLLVVQEVAAPILIKRSVLTYRRCSGFPRQRQNDSLLQWRRWLLQNSCLHRLCGKTALSPPGLNKLRGISIIQSRWERPWPRSADFLVPPQNQISFLAKQLPPRAQSPTL